MSRSKSVVLGLVLLLVDVIPAPAQQTLTLTSGDQLTGALVRIEDATWFFQYAGAELPIPAEDVVGFTAAEPIGIRLSDGMRLAARVSPVAGGLQLALLDGTTRVVAPSELAAVGDPDDLDVLRPVQIGLFSPFFKFWSSTISYGLKIKDGNSRTRDFSAYIEFRRESPRDRLAFLFQSSRENNRLRDGGLELTDEKYIGNLRVDIFIGRKWFVYANTRQQRDRFKDIDLRSFYTAGTGYQFLATENADLRASAAPGVRYEDFTSGGSTTVGIISLNSAFRYKLGPLAFDIAADGSSSVADLKDFQLVSISGITATIIAGFGFRIGLLYEFDSTPQMGREKHDATLTTNLMYSFGK